MVAPWSQSKSPKAQILSNHRALDRTANFGRLHRLQCSSASVTFGTYELHLWSTYRPVFNRYIILGCIEGKDSRKCINPCIQQLFRGDHLNSPAQFPGHLEAWHYLGGPCIPCLHSQCVRAHPSPPVEPLNLCLARRSVTPPPRGSSLHYSANAMSQSVGMISRCPAVSHLNMCDPRLHVQRGALELFPERRILVVSW